MFIDHVGHFYSESVCPKNSVHISNRIRADGIGNGPYNRHENYFDDEGIQARRLQHAHELSDIRLMWKCLSTRSNVSHDQKNCRSMAVPMMNIRNVLVLVGQAGMHVRMRMRFCHQALVLVLMVLVVNVQMLMKYGLVRVEMSMPLPD
jgi:hypothetical protein